MRTRMIFALLLILAPAAIAQQARPAELSALDYFQIQQLWPGMRVLSIPAPTTDTTMADLFTADGYFAPSMGARSARSFKGASGWRRLPAAARKDARMCPGSRRASHHIYVNHIITPTAEGLRNR